MIQTVKQTKIERVVIQNQRFQLQLSVAGYK